MRIEILDGGAFASALVSLNPGESFVSESGAMFRASANIDIDVTTKSLGTGGIFGGLKRMVAAENFFFSTYQVTNSQPGEVGLAPTLQGEVFQVDVEPTTAWLCTGGSYLGSGPGLLIDTRFQGFKGLLSGESLSYLRVSGSGPLLVTAFGRIVEMQVQDRLIVDTGHVVAFEETLEYKVTKAGGSWVQSFLAGEGMVLDFTGQGKILVQSHNPSAFGKEIGPLLPPRE